MPRSAAELCGKLRCRQDVFQAGMGYVNRLEQARAAGSAACTATLLSGEGMYSDRDSYDRPRSGPSATQSKSMHLLKAVLQSTVA